MLAPGGGAIGDRIINNRRDGGDAQGGLSCHLLRILHSWRTGGFLGLDSGAQMLEQLLTRFGTRTASGGRCEIGSMTRPAGNRLELLPRGQ